MKMECVCLKCTGNRAESVFIQSGLSFNTGGSFMVSGQCKGMYPDQPDRPRSVCSGDRLRTFFTFWSRSYAHFHYRCMAVCLSCWLFRTPYRLDDRNRTDPFCMLWISGGKTSQTVLKVKKDAAQMTEQLRYGEDNMPSGSLAQAASLEQGTSQGSE